MKRIILESPYGGVDKTTLARNIEYLQRCLFDCLFKGEAPFASHQMYTHCLRYPCWFCMAYAS